MINNKQIYRFLFSVVALQAVLPVYSIFAQASQEDTHTKQETSASLKISGYMQLWCRYTDLNPGSLVRQTPRSTLLDVSIRRYRIQLQGKAADKVSYVLVLGDNNLSYHTAGELRVRLLDAYVDYQVSPYLGIGLGKNGWAGLSRYTAPSASQPLTYDIPFVAVPLVNVYDDILRRPGIYARGQYKQLDYRFSLSKPSFRQALVHGQPTAEQANFSDKAPLYQFSGYVKYQFRERESQQSPWAAGTYLGEKNLFQLGIGSLYQPNTSWYVQGNDTLYHPFTALAADLFYETTFTRKRSITAYLAYFHYDLGKNFVRYMGVNNPATGVLPSAFINGAGNSAPVAGTGHLFMLQAGYLMPVGIGGQRLLQPFGAVYYAQLQALSQPAAFYHTGIHYYMNGQRAKITLGYENRPVFQQVGDLVLATDRKAMAVVQYQLQIGR